MPVVRKHHRQRAIFEQEMADAAASDMTRNIHVALGKLHTTAADARTPDPHIKSAAK